MVTNYRPIHFTSVASRIMEKVINADLLQHLTNNLLMPSQHGFLSRRSCTTCQLSFLDLVTTSLDNKQSIVILYLDMQKAFDRVPHERLLMKLSYSGVADPLLTWIRSFLSQRYQQVYLDGQFSERKPITSGVIQGSVLGPALFLTYINDIAQCFEFGSPFLFADDCKVVYTFTPDRANENLAFMHKDLAKLESWCHKWQMHFNVNKCQMLTSRCILPNNCLSLHSSPISVVQSVRDLGLHYSTTLNFSEHFSQLLVKCTRLTYLLSRHILTVDAKLSLYTSIIRPILEYGSYTFSLSNYSNLRAIESLQRRFTRSLLPNTVMSYRERCIRFKLQPLWLRRLKLNLILFYRIFFDPINKPLLNTCQISSSPYNLRLSFRIMRPKKYRTSARARFHPIFYSSIWNALPLSLRSSSSVERFKYS
ncbi:MAG: RNA-directed DNA polymerase, partial [Aeromonas sp.]